MNSTFRDLVKRRPPPHDEDTFKLYQASYIDGEGDVQGAINHVCEALMRPRLARDRTRIPETGDRKDVVGFLTTKLDLRSLRVATSENTDTTFDEAPFQKLVREWMSLVKGKEEKDLSAAAGLRKPDGCVAAWTTVSFPTVSDLPSVARTKPSDEPSSPHPFHAPSAATPSTPTPPTPAAAPTAAEDSTNAPGKASAERPPSRAVAKPAGRSSANSVSGRSSAAGTSGKGKAAGTSGKGKAASTSGKGKAAGTSGKGKAVGTSGKGSAVSTTSTTLSNELLLCYLVAAHEVSNCRLGLVIRGARFGRVAIMGEGRVLVEGEGGEGGVKLLGGVEQFFAILGKANDGYARLPRDLSATPVDDDFTLSNPSDYNAFCATINAAADLLVDLPLGDRIWRLPDPPLATPAWSEVWAAIDSFSIELDLTSEKDRLAVIAKRRKGGKALLLSLAQRKNAAGGDGEGGDATGQGGPGGRDGDGEAVSGEGQQGGDHHEASEDDMWQDDDFPERGYKDWIRSASEAGDEERGSGKEMEEEEEGDYGWVAVAVARAVMRRKGYLFFEAGPEVFDRLVKEMRGVSTTS
ncbi:hypothetical protein IAT38_001825 [Cryptococcus sp. DSM 104549]